MVLYAITFTVEGAELHLRADLPSEHGLDHAGAEMIRVRLGDEQVIELWLIGLTEHPDKDKVMQYIVHSIAQLLREAGYALPSSGQSASDDVEWIAVGPLHRVLHLDNLPDSLEK